MEKGIHQQTSSIGNKQAFDNQILMLKSQDLFHVIKIILTAKGIKKNKERKVFFTKKGCRFRQPLI